MKSELISIGKSRGVRLPKSLIELAGLTQTVEITLRPDGLLISRSRKPRGGWVKAFTAAYAELSADRDRDAQADDWCEALADDGPDAPG